MFRYGIVLPLAAVIGGFSIVGFVVREAALLDPQGPQQAAQSVAATLRAMPDPMPTAAVAGTTRAQDAARQLAQTIVALVPAEPVATPNFTAPNGLQLAAQALAVRLESGRDTVAASVVAPATATPASDNGSSRAQIAAQSIGRWLNGISSSQDGSDVQTAALQPSSTPIAKATVPDAKVAVPPVAPVIAAEVPSAAPAPKSEAPATVKVAEPATASPKPAETPAVVAQTSPPAPAQPAAPAADSKAVDPEIDQAAKDKAGNMADSLSKGFTDLLRTLSGKEQQPDPNAPADAAKSVTPPPELAAGAAGEVLTPVAATPSELVFSSLRFDPGVAETGVITLSGRGVAGRMLMLYLDGQQVGTTSVSGNGRWLLDVPKALPIGKHEARAELLASDGKPTHAAVFTFLRQAATGAGQESTIVPLAMTATAPSEPAAEPDKLAKADADSAARAVPATPTVADAVTPEAVVATKPELGAKPRTDKIKLTARSPASKAKAVKIARAQPAAKPITKKVAQRVAKAPARQVAQVARPAVRTPTIPVTVAVNRANTVVTVNIVRQGRALMHVYKGSKTFTIRVPDGIVRVNLGSALKPRCVRRQRNATARKATMRPNPRNQRKVPPPNHFDDDQDD